MAGVVTMGIGTVFSEIAVGISTFGGKMLMEGARAATHGYMGIVTSGGENLGRSFLTAAASSLMASGVGALNINNPLAQTAISSLTGGVTSVIGGGSFIEGAARGLVVGLLNHAAHQAQREIESDLILFFNGEDLYIVNTKYNEIVYSTKATSGKGEYMNMPEAQDIPNAGPIPEGVYTFKNSDWNSLSTRQQFTRLLKGGDWGTHNVPLKIFSNNNLIRDGFYLHGGLFEGSAGCIDAGSGVSKIYQLTKLQKITYLYVNYYY
ncbi:DUF2778 domain-containing protein [Bacteroidales bacterium OttesenSCG-928-J16]|nr:DUF2778 domain-containing protein [Bacteroidales bacterium OttesenSCG-928-J16]